MSNIQNLFILLIMTKLQQVHWFPGHMNKALKEIEGKVKLVDVVIELLDARAPFSSINRDFNNLVQNKKKLIVLSKIDLADQKRTNELKEKLSHEFDMILALDLTKPSSEKAIAQAVKTLGKEKLMKDISKGLKPQPIRAMIIGVPNVGKSSLINRLAKRNAAGVQNKPGYTRGEQWIKVNNDFLLLDTPGVLPMNYDDKEKSMKLAILGAIRQDIVPLSELCDALLSLLNKKYPDALIERFGIEDLSNRKDVLEQIALRRGLLKNNEPDIDKAEILLLNEFKNGKVGNFTLD